MTNHDKSPIRGCHVGFAATAVAAPYGQLLARLDEASPAFADALPDAAPGVCRDNTAAGCPRVWAPSVEEQSPVQLALRSALGGGISGGIAMFVNVGALMWLRTTINYQYRYGTTTGQALRHLYAEGGVARFYKGVGPALLQGPLSRFGDTAANAGMLTLLDGHAATQGLPIWLKTACASVAAGGFRILLMPIDTCKTVMQVEGANGMAMLRAKMATSGPTVLFSGAMGAATATLVGHWPWFFVNNSLQEYLPQYDRKTQLPMYLARNAAIGFCASAVSDTISNSIRVLKTTKQSAKSAITYRQAAELVIAQDGVNGLFFRGLKTKILANGAQGMLFSVLWRMGQDMLASRAAGHSA